ncbi:MAG TPA: TlpA disulfide reductase family protein [Vicinamibacterales bacterium]|nr:TlpA disulfide reductase family protein [Vicinamibacterales bacterium]
MIRLQVRMPARSSIHGAGVFTIALLAWSAAAFGASPGADDVCDAKPVAAKLNFTLKDVNDSKVKLADFKGKVIVLNFWATWCAPCKTEIPAFVELQTQYAEQGVQFLGLSVDDTLAKLKPYAAAMNMNYPVLQGRGHDEILDAFSPIPSLPVTIVIRRDGTVCKRHMAPVTKNILEREIKTLF